MVMIVENNEVLSKDKKILTESLSKLVNLTDEIGQKEMNETVTGLLARVDDPFLFVIVGEVKAGKSSFINALLKTDEDICKVAPSPMTDTIQQIVYGPSHTEENINPYLKKITFPEEILKEIAIVDTPGTNTIIDHHQEITEGFVPQSDLIVFVFEAKNPYRQSSWEFFDFIHEEWRKKAIFVLQQKDLVTPDDLRVNIEGVKSYARDRGVEKPMVFSVSAKQEQENDEDSGFGSLRNFIQENITGGQAPFLKIKSDAQTAININERIAISLSLRTDQWRIDEAFRVDIKHTLDEQESKTKKQIDFLVENLLASYDRITLKKEKELSDGLSFIPMIKRSFASFMGAKEGPKEWIEQLTTDFEQKLNIELREKLQSGVIDIADNIQTMAKLVDAKIKTSETILKNSDKIFADIAEKRSNILKDLQESFSKFMSTSENFYDHSMLQDSHNMAPNLAAGGGIAIVGLVLATTINGMVFDITGGILTTVGLLFAGATLGLKKRKILKAFRKEIERGREQIKGEVSQKLKDYTLGIKQKIDNNFSQFDDYLSHEEVKIEALTKQKDVIEDQLYSLLKSLS